jgi:hypothetical protein
VQIAVKVSNFLIAVKFAFKSQYLYYDKMQLIKLYLW